MSSQSRLLHLQDKRRAAPAASGPSAPRYLLQTPESAAAALELPKVMVEAVGFPSDQTTRLELPGSQQGEQRG